MARFNERLFNAAAFNAAALNRVLTDSVSLTEARTSEASLVLSDAITAADQSTYEAGLSLADTFTTQDAATATVEVALSDGASLSDALTSDLTSPDAPTVVFHGWRESLRNHEQTLSDAVALSDSLGFALQRGLSLADAVRTSDRGTLEHEDVIARDDEEVLLLMGEPELALVLEDDRERMAGRAF